MQVDQSQQQNQDLTLKVDLVQKREFSDEKRKELADKGHAMPDGSFPIENITDLHNAIQSIGRSKNYSKTKAHIIARAKNLQATSILPEDWKITKFIDDAKDAIEKAIGTSSSVDQERDERTVENYVRGNANTRVNNEPGDYTIGGNTMSSTTEPDPKGDIAVNKDFPSASGGPLIGSATDPKGDHSASAAPEGPVPGEATIPSDATSAVAPSKESEMNQPEKVSITKSTTCPDCGGSVVHECYGDSSDMNKAVDANEELEKAASADEVTEDSSTDETVEKAVDAPVAPAVEIKKSIWGGAFAPIK